MQIFFTNVFMARRAIPMIAFQGCMGLKIYISQQGRVDTQFQEDRRLELGSQKFRMTTEVHQLLIKNHAVSETNKSKITCSIALKCMATNKSVCQPYIIDYTKCLHIYSEHLKVNLLYISQGIDFLMRVSKDVNVVMYIYK